MTTVMLPRQLRIGGGYVDQLPDLVREVGASRPLVVTDQFLVSTGLVPSIVEGLRQAGLATEFFAETIPDPTTESLTAGLVAISAHSADLIVAVGGGSPMDTAKALALQARQGGQMRDYKAPHLCTGPALPLVAVPTTAGTGSEATHFTVITDSATKEKMLCAGPALLPVAAVVDFELTMSMPPRLTADTGVDALAHAVESFVSRRANEFSEMLSLRAIHAIGRNLRRVYRDGSDRAAREAMMLAATQAGMAMSNASVTLVHGMSRPLGSHFAISHGLSNAMLFPAVTSFSIGGAVARFAQCARALGCASDSHRDDFAAQMLVEELRLLNADLDVPGPQDLGISRNDWNERLPLMASQALASGSPANNPVVPSADEIIGLYGEVFGDIDPEVAAPEVVSLS